MSPRIKPNSPPLPPPARKLFSFRPKIWFSLLLLMAFALGAHFAWMAKKPQIARDPHYLLTAENIHVTTPPAWIRSDVKTQALRDAGLLETLSALDDWEILSRRLKEAFEFHPWVASVERIS